MIKMFIKSKSGQVNIKLYIFLAVLLALTYWLLSLAGTEWLERLELVTFNFRMKLRGPLTHSDKVKIIAIDEQSLYELYHHENNPWPWTRDIYAEIINKISAAEVKSIIIDISFATLDPDHKDKDLAFAETLFNNPYITIGTSLINSRSEFEKLPSFYRKKLTGENDYFRFRYKIVNPPQYYLPDFFSTYKLVPPEELFKNSVWAYGTFEIGLPSPDGIYHHLPLVINEEFINTRKDISLFLLPNIDILGLSAYCGLEPGDYSLDFKNKQIKLGDKYEIPIDKNGYLTLNYYGKQAFPEISVADIMEMEVTELRKLFRDRLVLIGYTARAKGIFDARPTPFNKNESGIQLHATAIQNIIDEDYLHRLPVGINVLIIFLLLMISLRINLIKKLKYSILLGILLIILFNIVNYILFTYNIWLDQFYPNLVMVIVLFYTNIIKIYREHRAKMETKEYFSRYVPPEVVENILRDPSCINPGGEEKEITVLFSDIVDFTRKAEMIKAGKLVDLLNEYFKEMTEIIKNQFGGTVDKYVGDSIVAIFGAPFTKGNDSLRAVNTALAMREKQQELKEKWEKRGEKVVFEMGIGISTGKAIIGNIGSPERVNYTCIGDTVNIAARLEQATRTIGADILICSTTYHQVKEYFACRKITDLKVKGKDDFLTVYAVNKRSEKNESFTERDS